MTKISGQFLISGQI